jgi:hypothetical protein
MSTQFWATSAVFERQNTKLLQRGLGAVLLVGALIAVAGCAAPSQPLFSPDAADPSVRVPPTRYRSTLGPYSSQRPVEPGDWLGTNERVTPQPKPGR